MQDSQQIRRAILARWHESLSGHGGLYSSDSISGTSPPSVFVGEHGYPRVSVGPLLPPVHGDTALLDAPERWGGRSLEAIVNFRLGLVRGARGIRADETEGRYVEGLQELAMSSRPADSDVVFEGAASARAAADGESAPFGPVGTVRSARFSPASPDGAIQRAFYDRDLAAGGAVVELYGAGVEVSRIQRCLSVGMLGRKRRLVPTKWSITATDDIISRSLAARVLGYGMADSHMVFSHSHLGNRFAVVLFPHRWIYEMIEAWYSGGVIGFGSDREDARGIGHRPAIAGAYFAAKLAVLEYMEERRIQAGAVVLREILPEYAIPVGVWQVREGVREAMRRGPVHADGFGHAISLAAAATDVGPAGWLAHGRIRSMMGQRTISDFVG